MFVLFDTGSDLCYNQVVRPRAGRTGAAVNRRERRWAMLVTIALVTASSLPYLIAWAVRPEGTHFTGLLFNPQDSNSYIAKMRQGFTGSWRFQLPYTPDPHAGAHIYLYYLILGHLARWTSLPLIMIYHTVRGMGSAVMFLALYALASQLSDDVSERRVMFLLAAFGAGLGWLVGPLGVVTADLWVPEAFPVYALLTNAHFPLAIGLMIGIAACGLRTADRIGQARRRNIPHDPRVTPKGENRRGKVRYPRNRHQCLWGLGTTAGAMALGLIQPFGLVAVLGGLGVMLAAQVFRRRAVPWQAVAWIAGAGTLALVYPLYTLWAMRHDPVLAAWNMQNVTPSPKLWDWALSYGLVLALALLGAFSAAQRKSDGDWLLLGWVIVTLVGMYVPLQLQRRLSLGLGIPMGLLAGMGWWRAVRPRVRDHRQKCLQGLTVAFCALTPLFLVLMTLLAAVAGEPWLYLSNGEWAALEWLRDEGEPSAVILCAPQTGLFVPAWAGQRVVYGHPFETVDAEKQKAQVEAYWAGEMSPSEQKSFLRENRVRYVLVGPRELEIADCGSQIADCKLQIAESSGEPVFEAGGVSVYQLNEQ